MDNNHGYSTRLLDNGVGVVQGLAQLREESGHDLGTHEPEWVSTKLLWTRRSPGVGHETSEEPQWLQVSVMGVAGQSGRATGVASGGRVYRTVSDWAMKMCTVSMLAIYA